PAVLRSPAGWVVRYGLAVWTPGSHTLALPPLWRIGPDGRTDSSAGGAASVVVVSVLPDTLKAPDPRGPLGPLRLERRNAGPPPAAGPRATSSSHLQFHWNVRCRMRAGSPPASPGPSPPARPGGCGPRWRGRCPRRMPRSIRTSVSAWWSGRGPERAWASCATCWSSSIASPSPAPRGPMSRRWRRGRGAWPRSWPRELRPALHARRPGPLAPVVVAADAAAEPAVGDAHERRATGDGSGRAPLDRAAPRLVAHRLPGRAAHRCCGPPCRLG